MIPTYGQRLLTEFMARKQAKGANLCSEEIVSAADDMVGVFLAEERAKWEVRHKAKKKSPVDPRAQDILNVYPRREGSATALVSITKAIAQDGFEKVLERTVEYASAVARWSWARKRSQSGTSLIPLPSTFYNGRRYLDDSSQWWAGTGGKHKVEESAKITEPENWRQHFPDYIHAQTDWSNIDEASQKYICQQMQEIRGTG